MKNVRPLSCALFLATACGHEEEGLGDPTTTPATSESSSGSPTADDDTTASEGAAEDRGTTTRDDETTAGRDDDTTASADESTGADRRGGLCDWSCTVVSECIPLGADPTAYACTDGFCEFLVSECELCGDDESFGCVHLDGEETCVIFCPNGDECAQYDLECTGIDDDGLAFCRSAPCDSVFAEGEPCAVAGYGQNGVCRGGVCSCVDDTECTVAGTACHLR